MTDNHMEPCPFCGAHAVFEPRMDCTIIKCSRRHNGCPVNMRTTTAHKTFKEAQAAWNTRAANKAAQTLADEERAKGMVR